MRTRVRVREGMRVKVRVGVKVRRADEQKNRLANLQSCVYYITLVNFTYSFLMPNVLESA